MLNALEETENALVDYNQQRARQALLASAAQASEKADELAHLRFKEGVSDFLTVLTALYKALGGGWEYTAETNRNK